MDTIKYFVLAWKGKRDGRLIYSLTRNPVVASLQHDMEAALQALVIRHTPRFETQRAHLKRLEVEFQHARERLAEGEPDARLIVENLDRFIADARSRLDGASEVKAAREKRIIARFQKLRSAYARAFASSATRQGFPVDERTLEFSFAPPVIAFTPRQLQPDNLLPEVGSGD